MQPSDTTRHKLHKLYGWLRGIQVECGGATKFTGMFSAGVATGIIQTSDDCETQVTQLPWMAILETGGVAATKDVQVGTKA